MVHHQRHQMGLRLRPRLRNPGPGPDAGASLDPRFGARCPIIVVMNFFLACFISMYIFYFVHVGEGVPRSGDVVRAADEKRHLKQRCQYSAEITC